MGEGSVIIIAEAGVNHNGELSRAKDLIRVAAESGADFVKFQTFRADKLVSKSARKADYQMRNLESDESSQLGMLRKLEMPEDWHKDLMALASELKIGFLSTGFDEESIDFLARLGIPLFKVPSGELTNKRYLQHIARKGKPIILSTGMADESEVGRALDVLLAEGVRREDVAVLHCNTEYPTPMKDVNLLAMDALRKRFNVSVGYSDHTLGIEVPIAAVALGAKVIEKHFTLDRTLPGPDHKASLEPSELREMVRAIRNIELAISGNAIKAPSESELKNVAVARKSIHLRVDIPKGTRIDESLLVMKRPGDGISPMDIDAVIGRVINRDLTADDKLLWEHLEQ